MGLQDRDYYWEKQQSNAKAKPSRLKRASRPIGTANQPPDLLDMLSRISFAKYFFILVALGCAGFFSITCSDFSITDLLNGNLVD